MVLQGSEVVARQTRERYEIIEYQTGLYRLVRIISFASCELNAMFYRIKVIGQNLFFRLANGEPGTPVCYFCPKCMNR